MGGGEFVLGRLGPPAHHHLGPSRQKPFGDAAADPPGSPGDHRHLTGEIKTDRRAGVSGYCHCCLLASDWYCPILTVYQITLGESLWPSFVWTTPGADF